MKMTLLSAYFLTPIKPKDNVWVQQNVHTNTLPEVGLTTKSKYGVRYLITMPLHSSEHN